MYEEVYNVNNSSYAEKAPGGFSIPYGVTRLYFNGSSSSNYVTVTWNGNTVSWSANDSAAHQCNNKVSYRYVAFG